MTYRIIHQTTPTRYTTASSLVVEASSKEEAYATAYDHLTRRGHIVGAYDSLLTDRKGLMLDVAKVREFGVPNVITCTQITIIQSIEPHQITSPGRVVEG